MCKVCTDVKSFIFFDVRTDDTKESFGYENEADLWILMVAFAPGQLANDVWTKYKNNHNISVVFEFSDLEPESYRPTRKMSTGVSQSKQILFIPETTPIVSDWPSR